MVDRDNVMPGQGWFGVLVLDGGVTNISQCSFETGAHQRDGWLGIVFQESLDQVNFKAQTQKILAMFNWFDSAAGPKSCCTASQATVAVTHGVDFSRWALVRSVLVLVKMSRGVETYGSLIGCWIY